VNNATRLSSSLSAGSDWFEDWPEANDEAASIYIALTAEPSSSQQMPVETSRQPRGLLCTRPQKVESKLAG
jgi:hypothetical protein